MVVTATFYLFYLFLTHQFQVKYVFQYSSRALPVGLLISSLWAGQQGSFLFWMLVSELGYREPAGLLLSSADGLEWSEASKGYPSPATFMGRNQRLEEPNLLFKDGRPTHLFNVMGACPEDDACSGFVFKIVDE